MPTVAVCGLFVEAARLLGHTEDQDRFTEVLNKAPATLILLFLAVPTVAVCGCVL